MTIRNRYGQARARLRESGVFGSLPSLSEAHCRLVIQFMQGAEERRYAQSGAEASALFRIVLVPPARPPPRF